MVSHPPRSTRPRATRASSASGSNRREGAVSRMPSIADLRREYAQPRPGRGATRTPIRSRNSAAWFDDAVKARAHRRERDDAGHRVGRRRARGAHRCCSRTSATRASSSSPTTGARRAASWRPTRARACSSSGPSSSGRCAITGAVTRVSREESTPISTRARSKPARRLGLAPEQRDRRTGTRSRTASSRCSTQYEGPTIPLPALLGRLSRARRTGSSSGRAARAGCTIACATRAGDGLVAA